MEVVRRAGGAGTMEQDREMARGGMDAVEGVVSFGSFRFNLPFYE